MAQDKRKKTERDKLREKFENKLSFRQPVVALEKGPE